MLINCKKPSLARFFCAKGLKKQEKAKEEVVVQDFSEQTTPIDEPIIESEPIQETPQEVQKPKRKEKTFFEKFTERFKEFLDNAE